jgi:hypothetical protein
MFRALLTHPQKVPHKRRLAYCVRIMSVGCGAIAVSPLFQERLGVIQNLCSLYDGITRINLKEFYNVSIYSARCLRIGLSRRT